MNDENLISLADRTTEEQREIARMGGIRSGEVRRERKRLRECLSVALGMTCEVEGEEYTNAELVAASMVNEAKGGNVRAATLLLDYTEGKPRQCVEVQTISEEARAEVEAILSGIEVASNEYVEAKDNE